MSGGIRGLIPAASLKRGQVRRLAAPVVGHPRVNPRGLIEAPRRSRRASPGGRRGIRGLIPAASLKLHHIPAHAAAWTGIRGLIPAASLKHPAARWRLASASAGIRGLIPAASLKHVISPPVRQGKRVRHPRVNPRGLIEASSESRPRRSHRTRHPRVNPRGLIEASRAWPARMAPGGHPRVNPRGLIEADPNRMGLEPGRGRHPRVNPRGLIEASSPVGPDVRRCRGIRGLIPAASLKHQPKVLIVHWRRWASAG